MSLSRYLSKLAALVGSDGKVPTAGLADGSVTTAKLSTGAPAWDSSGNATIGNSLIVGPASAAGGQVRSQVVGYQRMQQVGATRYRADIGVSGAAGNINAFDDTGAVYLPLTYTGINHTFYIGSGGNLGGLAISSNGYVTHPRQPRFRIGSSSESTTYTNDSTLKMASNEYDPMNCYDPTTGRFTVPSGGAGFYRFSYCVRIDNNTTNYSAYIRVRPFKNGAHCEWLVGDPIYPVVFFNGNTYASMQMSWAIELADSDYVELRIGWGGGGPSSVILSNSGWSGYLVA